MACEAFEEDLSAWIDGELTPAEEARLAAHLQSCRSCTALLRDFQDTSLLVRQLPLPRSPAFATEATMDLLRAVRHRDSEPWLALARARRFLFDPFLPKVGVKVVGLAVAIALAVFVGREEFMINVDHGNTLETTEAPPHTAEAPPSPSTPITRSPSPEVTVRGFDDTATPNTALLSPGALTPGNSEKANELSALQHAADQGQLDAQWKIGRMLADGDGVAQNDLRAFEYFSRIANTHASEPPGTAQAHIVASAFVALGRYYLKGIPNSAVQPDAARARQMFLYAASYFGDGEGQYELGRLYLTSTPSDAHEAMRWLLLAASKGHCGAEVALGDILFRGQQVPRQAARGLMWLELGRDCAGADEPGTQGTLRRRLPYR